ncbi:MAG: hypothetical protein ACRDRG_14315, partial [Pseudonocardiaceae bacterium]
MMTTKIYLQTRGVAPAAGYRFLGAEPEQAWWLDYGKFTAFEDATILVESDAGGWRVFLSGIPSSRVDTTGTTNRFTIVIESADRDGDHVGLVAGLVSTWIGDIKDQQNEGELQHALDEVFTDNAVTRLYAQEGDEAWREVRNNVQRALRALRALRVLDEPPEPAVRMSAWIAPVRWREGRAGFIGRVRKLLDRDHGAAILVNLACSPHAFRNARPADGRLFVLALDEDRKLDEKFDELPRVAPGKDELPRAVPEKKALVPAGPR